MENDELKSARPYKITLINGTFYEVGREGVTVIYYNRTNQEVDVHMGKHVTTIKIFKHAILEIEFEYVNKNIINS